MRGVTVNPALDESDKWPLCHGRCIQDATRGLAQVCRLLSAYPDCLVALGQATYLGTYVKKDNAYSNTC